jgi:hypothetical protein
VPLSVGRKTASLVRMTAAVTAISELVEVNRRVDFDAVEKIE